MEKKNIFQVWRRGSREQGEKEEGEQRAGGAKWVGMDQEETEEVQLEEEQPRSGGAGWGTAESRRSRRTGNTDVWLLNSCVQSLRAVNLCQQRCCGIFDSLWWCVTAVWQVEITKLLMEGLSQSQTNHLRHLQAAVEAQVHRGQALLWGSHSKTLRLTV